MNFFQRLYNIAFPADLKRIYIVRHGQSKANVNAQENQKYGDHTIPLTDEGKRQAERAGQFLDDYIANLAEEDYKKLRFWSKVLFLLKIKLSRTNLWVSPYRRTRETADSICKHAGHLFYKRKEDPLLVEQQFGLFNGLSYAECEAQFPAEWAAYQRDRDTQGKFWPKKPMGNSPFNIMVHIRIWQGSVFRDIEKHRVENLVVTSHGVTSRVIAMCYLRQTPEEYHEENNPNNCAIRLLEKVDGVWIDKGYIYSGD